MGSQSSKIPIHSESHKQKLQEVFAENIKLQRLSGAQSHFENLGLLDLIAPSHSIFEPIRKNARSLRTHRQKHNHRVSHTPTPEGNGTPQENDVKQTISWRSPLWSPSTTPTSLMEFQFSSRVHRDENANEVVANIFSSDESITSPNNVPCRTDQSVGSLELTWDDFDLKQNFSNRNNTKGSSSPMILQPVSDDINAVSNERENVQPEMPADITNKEQIDLIKNNSQGPTLVLNAKFQPLCDQINPPAHSVLINYQYNFENNKENIVIQGDMESLLAENDQKSNLKSIDLFFQNLPYFINNLNGALYWNGYYLKTNQKFTLLEYKISPTTSETKNVTIIISLQEFCHVRVTRSPKKLSIRGYHSLEGDKNSVEEQEISYFIIKGKQIKKVVMSPPDERKLELCFPIENDV